MLTDYQQPASPAAAGANLTASEPRPHRSRRLRPAVALYAPNYPGVTQDGGIGTYTKDLAHGLAALGHAVHVLTPGAGPAVDDGPVAVRQVSTRHLPGLDRLMPGLTGCWRVSRELHRLVSDRGVQLVELANWEGRGLLFQRRASVPVVVRLSTSAQEAQQIDALPTTRTHRWDVRRERWQARRADALVTHSRAHRDVMAAELDIPAERIRVIPLGIPVYPDFQRPQPAGSAATIVYLGRLEKRKGTLDLLHAIPRVLARFPRTRFVFIGSDRPHCPGNRTHAQYVADEFPPAIRGQIQLLGRLPQEQVDRWLQTADVFVAPSQYESFGLIFPEAMRWGTPVVGTQVGGIPEIVADGQTGLLVQPQQPDALAAAIVRLLDDAELRHGLGTAGRRHVETHFTVERMARATADLYEEVLARHSQRRTAHVAAAG